MTTYVTAFSEYTADVQPADWTARWVTTNSTWAARVKSGTDGGQTLEHTSTADGRRLLSWDDIDADANRANAEILARVRTSNVAIEQFRLHVRASGAAGSENGYHFTFNSSSGLSVNKYVAGTGTTIGSTVSISWLTNTWYYMRFRANGTALKAKWWADGTDEPAAWTIEVTDSSISAAGWVGVGNFESDGTRDFDYVSIGTNGDTAPLNAGVDTLARATQIVTEVASANALKAMMTQIVVEMASENVPDDPEDADGPSMIIIAT